VPRATGVKLKDPSAFRSSARVRDRPRSTTGHHHGRAVYGIDARLEGMLYAVVARPPVFGGKAVRFDAAEAMKVPGVVKVFAIDPPQIPSEFQPLGGVAVIARNTWAAIKGREALKIDWEDGPHAAYSSDSYRAQLSDAARKPGKVVRNEGDVEAAMKGAAKRVEAEYYIPHLAQAPLEPPAALVRIVDGRAEAWACTQAPEATRTRLAQRLGLPDDKVRVNVTLLGGGFGRKSKPDFVIEAGLCSQAVDGAPVKLTWTREDDLHHGYYHTVSVERLEAGLDASARRSPGCTGAPRRPSARSSRRTPSTSCPSSSGWGSSTRPSRSRTSGPRTRRRRPMSASAGSGRCRTSRTPSRSSPSWPNWPTRLAAIRRTTSWS
jgi:isoquinoline 1-oxidoreductase beta subunit